VFVNFAHLPVAVGDDEFEEVVFALFAARFSLSVLLATVFELFEPALSLFAIARSQTLKTREGRCSVLQYGQK
jgi:hypothetical protein